MADRTLLLSLLLLASAARAQLPPALARVADKYGIAIEVLTKSIDWHGDGYKVTADAPDPSKANLAAYAELFEKEWSLYPPELIKKVHLKKIVIGVNLAMNGQLRAAVPAFDGDTMYYDGLRGATSRHYQRIVIHHEFFHLLDQRMGALYKDPEWSKLNPPEFRYGDGGAKMQAEHSKVGELTDAYPGFLTVYGTSGLEEDKAELFAHAVVDGPVVADRAKSDSILAKKLELLRSRLAALDRSMGDAFWKQIAGWQPEETVDHFYAAWRARLEGAGSVKLGVVSTNGNAWDHEFYWSFARGRKAAYGGPGDWLTTDGKRISGLDIKNRPVEKDDLRRFWLAGFEAFTRPLDPIQGVGYVQTFKSDDRYYLLVHYLAGDTSVVLCFDPQTRLPVGPPGRERINPAYFDVEFGPSVDFFVAAPKQALEVWRALRAKVATSAEASFDRVEKLGTRGDYMFADRETPLPGRLPGLDRFARERIVPKLGAQSALVRFGWSIDDAYRIELTYGKTRYRLYVDPRKMQPLGYDRLNADGSVAQTVYYQNLKLTSHTKTQEESAHAFSLCSIRIARRRLCACAGLG